MTGENRSIKYKFRTMSVKHLDELQTDIDRIKQAGKLSNNDLFQGYISSKSFVLPDELPNAKAVIILAVFTRLMLVDFHLDGQAHEVMIPPQYYDSGLRRESLESIIREEIIGEPGYALVNASHLHLKLTAVRSGLAKYGRNNISYVDEMGSLITIYAYFTDYEFTRDDWTEISMMEQCQTCRVCINKCPMGTIQDDEQNFVIDVSNCITLYNEVEGEFPAHIPADAHNALMGCMSCQFLCPANKKALKEPGRLESISDQETRMILTGEYDTDIMQKIEEKLQGFSATADEQYYPVFTRNLKALIGE